MLFLLIFIWLNAQLLYQKHYYLGQLAGYHFMPVTPSLILLEGIYRQHIISDHLC